MKKIIERVLIAFSAFVLYGCYYDNPPIIEPPSSVSFADDIQPIFDQNCISCHSGSLDPDLTAGNSYNSLKGLIVSGDAASSELYQRLNGTNGQNLMPPGSPLAKAQIDLVGQWIDEGAKNN